MKHHLPRYDDNHRWNYLVEQTLRVDQVKFGRLIMWMLTPPAHFMCLPLSELPFSLWREGTGILHASVPDPP